MPSELYVVTVVLQTLPPVDPHFQSNGFAIYEEGQTMTHYELSFGVVIASSSLHVSF